MQSPLVPTVSGGTLVACCRTIVLDPEYGVGCSASDRLRSLRYAVASVETTVGDPWGERAVLRVPQDGIWDFW